MALGIVEYEVKLADKELEQEWGRGYLYGRESDDSVLLKLSNNSRPVGGTRGTSERASSMLAEIKLSVISTQL